MKIFKEFEGKTAFVTGAASGMGQAAAICFGGLGCRVAVAARNPKALETVQTIRENGGEAIFVECDVTDDDSVRNAIETTVKTFSSTPLLSLYLSLSFPILAYQLLHLNATYFHRYMAIFHNSS